MTCRIVLVGAGHAHVGVLRDLSQHPLPGAHLTLLTPSAETPYSGMLPGYVAGLYRRDEMHIDAGSLARRAGVRVCQDEAIGLDLASRHVSCSAHPPLPYDVVSLDIGSSPNVGTVPGAAEHAIPVKPISSFLPRFDALRARVLAGRSRRVVLVGAGAGGVELLLSVERRLRRDAPDQALRFTLVAGSSDILPSFPPAFRARFRRILAARGIALRTGARVIGVDEAGVRFPEGRIDADEVLWAAEASPARWLAGTGLALDPRGFLRVDAALRAIGRNDVFAAGDMVAFDPGALPRSGVYAVRAGPVLAANLRATATGDRLRRYRPQPSALYVVSTGERYAVATRNGLTLGGAWAWHLKDHIDRRFVAQFNGSP